MPTDRPLERCYKCDEPTGRAGRSDDSLYCDECGRGPYCSDCMKQHEENQIVVDTCPGYNVAGIRCPEDQTVEESKLRDTVDGDEPEFSARVLWESNGAIIECYLWDEAPGEFEDDLLELSIKPGPALGKPHNLLMDLNDAWALVSVISQCAIKLQTKITEEKEILDGQV